MIIRPLHDLHPRFPDQIYLGHSMIMILKLMHTQGLRNMPPILPIPHLKIGKIPFPGQKDPERPIHILHRPIRLLLLFKVEFHQLSLIQRDWKKMGGLIPKTLNTGLYANQPIGPIQLGHLSLPTLSLELCPNDISASQLMEIDHTKDFFG
jgi:hypothetical protein